MTTPIRPSDVFSSIPGPCLHSVVLLFIRLLRATTAAADPDASHRAFVHLHMFATVVLRKPFRGEPGWPTTRGHLHALRQRIRNASAGQQWAALQNEAITSHHTRQEWHLRHPGRPKFPTSPSPRTACAMRLASQAQYIPRLCVLLPTNRLLTLKPGPRLPPCLPSIPPPEPITPLPREALPPCPDVTESSVLRAVLSLNPISAVSPDRMCTGLFHLIAKTNISPEAGVTGPSALIHLVRRLPGGDLPTHTILLISSAKLIPLQPYPGKIRPTAIGQALRRLVTKALLPAAISDRRHFLAPQQMASGVPTGLDAIVHDAGMLMRQHGHDDGLIMVSIDATNAFNRFPGQRMLDMLPIHTPSLARFITMIYGHSPPYLITPTCPLTIFMSQEVSQQGCPASSLLFSLAVHPLIRRLSQECDLSMNCWYADDGTLIGRIEEVKKRFRYFHAMVLLFSSF